MMICGTVSLGLEGEMPSSSTISSVPLVEQISQDSPGETEGMEGSKSNRADLRDMTQAIAALLWQGGENHSVDNLWRGCEAYVGDGLHPVPQKIME